MLMKSLFSLVFGPTVRKPVFADENAERAMKIAELKWLLSEIAERPARDLVYPKNDNWMPRRGRVGEAA
jgi:hypothetical protein